jgi:hypothetical protein
MATSQDLYMLRRDVVQRRQPNHLTFYDNLHNYLKNTLGKDQPYDLLFDLKAKFECFAPYVNQRFGPNAHIPPGDGYLYRICTVKDLVSGTTRWLADFEDEPDIAVWDLISGTGLNQWFPLREFGAGTYTCRPRAFSWWTTFPLYSDVISGAHRIGMTNDWVPFQCFVLRCPTTYVSSMNLACVPSVIDAFMQKIFHATRDSTSPWYGVTIDLSMFPETIFPGIDELMLPAVDVNQLDVLAIEANDVYCAGKNNVTSNDPILLDMLAEYYKRL